MNDEKHICGAEQTAFGVQCELELGHNSPHKHTDFAGGTLTWEPRYVGDLRSEVKELRERLMWAEEDRDEYRNKLANYDPSVGFVSVSEENA